MEVTTATYILAEATGSERPGKEATGRDQWPA